MFRSRCTSPDQSDHKTEVQQVHYPWHPLYGQDVIVRGRKGGRCSVLRCQLDDDDKRDNRQVPMWMFDKVVCSRMVLSSQPHVCWEALLDLRRLLDDSGQTKAGETLEDRFLQTMEGTDAPTRQTNCTSAGGAVRSSERSTKLARPTRRHAKNSNAVACTDAEATAPSSGVSGAGGGG